MQVRTLWDGIIGLNDYLFLDLKKGKYGLLVVKSVWFGGWRFKAKMKG